MEADLNIQPFVNPMMVTRELLERHRNDVIFVFGDNVVRSGTGGAAQFRFEPNTYGFITKQFPENSPEAFYQIHEYEAVFKQEVERLKQFMNENADKKFYISAVGAGLANRYGIWEAIIQPNLKEALRDYWNCIVWLW